MCRAGAISDLESELSQYTIINAINMGESPGLGDESFRTCKRGPVGPPGRQGMAGVRGPRGEQGIRGQKGEQGSFDFLQAMMADVRHDIEQLQAAVFVGGRKPRRYGLTRPSRRRDRVPNSESERVPRQQVQEVPHPIPQKLPAPSSSPNTLHFQ